MINDNEPTIEEFDFDKIIEINEKVTHVENLLKNFIEISERSGYKLNVKDMNDLKNITKKDKVEIIINGKKIIETELFLAENKIKEFLENLNKED